MLEPAMLVPANVPTQTPYNYCDLANTQHNVWYLILALVANMHAACTH